MLKCGRCRGSSPTFIINISRYSCGLCARESAAAVEALADLRGPPLRSSSVNDHALGGLGVVTSVANISEPATRAGV